MADQRPIGIMDSGLGGVSVLRAAKERLPQERFVFWADNANAPYGEKSEEQIHALSFAIAERLAAADAKIIVIACNTATSAAVEDIRKQCSVPVISMEPAIKPALEAQDKAVLMLATRATCRLARYQQLKARLDDKGRIRDLACLHWVECIEDNIAKEAAPCREMIQSTLAPYADVDIGAVVLGCTHYPLLEKQIEQVIQELWGKECQLFDGRAGTVRQLERVLIQQGLQTDRNTPAPVEFHATNPTQEYIALMRAIYTNGQQPPLL